MTKKIIQAKIAPSVTITSNYKESETVGANIANELVFELSVSQDGNIESVISESEKNLECDISIGRGEKGEKGDTPSIEHLEKKVDDKLAEFDGDLGTYPNEVKEARVDMEGNTHESLKNRLEQDLGSLSLVGELLGQDIFKMNERIDKTLTVVGEVAPINTEKGHVWIEI